MKTFKWQERQSERVLQKWVSACARHLLNDGLAILPTETGYMLAANGLSESALERLYEAKGRPAGQATHLAIASATDAGLWVELGEYGAELLAAWAPGPLTLVGKTTGRVPPRILGPNDTLGVRIPDHELTHRVLEAVSVPLTTTSANRAGCPHERSLEAILDQFPSEVTRHWFVGADDLRRFEKPSTMLRVDPENRRWDVLREGAIPLAVLRSSQGD